MLLYFSIVAAVIFRDINRGMYFGRMHGDVVMTPYPEEAMDLSIQDTDPVSISALLSLGTKALTIERNSTTLALGDIQFNDKRQFFKIILTPSGTYIFQHDDLCVGYSGNFTHKLIDATNKSPYVFTEMIECTDTQNIMSFVKSEKIDGEARTKRVVSITEEPTERAAGPKVASVTKYEEQTLKPEETGFLKGLVGRVTHLF